MFFVTFERDSHLRLGLMAGRDAIIDLPDAFAVLRRQRRLPPFLAGVDAFPEDMLGLIRRPGPALDVARLIAELPEGDPARPAYPLAQGRLRAPIPRPTKNVFCVGRNYNEHIAEGDRARGQVRPFPEHPEFFSKPPTSIIGPDDPIRWDPEVTQQLDYEVELAVVVGKPGINIPRAKAYDHVFGYTVLNDITARDLQRRHGQWFKGKGLDTTCPMGPFIVHRSAIADPHGLGIRLRVNGDTRQSANTRDMVWDIPTLLATLSQGMTLEPGDIIATGTPGGVGWVRTPPLFLGAGDVVEAEIDEIGNLRNRIEKVRLQQTDT